MQSHVVIAILSVRLFVTLWFCAVMLNQAKTSGLRPELRGRGQFLEVEAKAEAKNNYEKSTK